MKPIKRIRMIKAELRDGKLYIDGVLTTPTEELMCQIRIQCERI
jgi:hypothetical protein